LYQTAENLIHIDLQPIWHVHKFLSFKNFVHKKIFFCKPPHFANRRADRSRRRLQIKKTAMLET